MQDCDNVGAEFGNHQMSFDTLDSKIAKGLVKILNPSREQFSWPKRFKKTHISRCCQEDGSLREYPNDVREGIG